MLDQGYGIMPNKILFNTGISASAKLLFCYISSLCAKEGYCWATNESLGKKLQLSKSQVSRLVNILVGYGYVELISNKTQNRKLRINAEGGTHKCVGGYAKTPSPLYKDINNTNIISSNSEEVVEDEEEESLPKLLEYYREVRNLANIIHPTEERLKLFRARQKDSTFEELKLAIDATTRKRSFYGGENDRGWKANIDYILRKRENVEKMVEDNEENKKSRMIY